jgi:hypothetical protein
MDMGPPGSPDWRSETGTTVELPPDVSLIASATVAFAPTGMATGSTFTLSNLMGSYQVTVALTGQVRACRGACP